MIAGDVVRETYKGDAMPELTNEQMLLIMTVCDLLGKTADPKAVISSFERAKLFLDRYQNPTLPSDGY